MRIEFVNHSSFIIQHAATSIIIDPWIDGLVFNNGWDLICPTAFKYDDFRAISHIWFSHEHPDHFNPPNLIKIAPEIRQRITVLFQRTPDKRVVNFCKKLGFADVVECQREQWIDLGSGAELLCEPFDSGDSWVAVRAHGKLLLNTNDCGMRQPGWLQKLKERLGEIDVLTTQFSYAFWGGNEDDKSYRERLAQEKLDGMKLQIDVLKPTFTIPIASYVKFCHEENKYINDSINTADRVEQFLLERTSTVPIILYPGDQWEVGEEHDNASSLERYRPRFAAIGETKNWRSSPVVPFEQLRAQSLNFARNMRDKFGWQSRFAGRASLYLWDHSQSYSLSARRGLEIANVAPDACDIALGSDSLLLCLKEPWGMDTLGVNGRYRKPRHGKFEKFYNLFRFNQLASRGIKVDARYIAGAIGRKARSKLRLAG